MEQNNVDTVIKDGPIQPDVQPIQDSGPQVIESTIYQDAKAPSPGVVAEHNHANDIAMNSTEADNTFDHTPPVEKEYDKTLHTSTVQSTGAELKGAWESKYTMDEGYQAKEGEDFTWNKIAEQMSQADYDKEANQYRAQSIEKKQQINQAQTKAFNDYFAAEYSAKQTQDKMGWSGGQEQASDLQVKFLQAESAANMYTQEEMQKYGMNSKLSIARKYAEANQRALALKLYQDELSQAVKEGELTGYYVPPEAKEMFKQQKIADDILKNKNSTDEERERARQVNANCEAYYASKGFERGYRYDEKTGEVVSEFYGMKILSQLTYEETVRNNKVNEELQKQAIAAQNTANGIAELQLKQAKEQFDLERFHNELAMSDRIGQSADSERVTTHESNYYFDSKGNKVSVKPGTKIRKTNGRFYVMNDKGMYVPMWNSDKGHAEKHAEATGNSFVNYRDPTKDTPKEYEWGVYKK